MRYCQEKDEKQRPNNADELKTAVKENLGFHTTSVVPQTDHLHATPKAVIKAKVAPTKYLVHIQ